MSGEVISGIVAGTVYIDITTDGMVLKLLGYYQRKLLVLEVT